MDEMRWYRTEFEKITKELIETRVALEQVTFERDKLLKERVENLNVGKHRC